MRVATRSVRGFEEDEVLGLLRWKERVQEALAQLQEEEKKVG